MGNIPAHTIECRSALVKKLMRVYGNAVVLPERQVITIKQHTAGSALRKRYGQDDCHLHASRFARGGVEDAREDLSGVDIAIQDCVSFAGIGHDSKPCLG